ncbi:metaxin-3-like isoform X2 [Watersipora subatra]|uniref:metaxin-3-like isoform X2 n=1 Tax=Watersipora subatra TaxID=2589382 RepID=UPI00355BA723
MGTRLSEETLVLDETNDSRNDVELRLNVFPPKSGLPSFDPTSLAVLAYCKFGNAQVEIKSDGFSRLGFINDGEAIPSLTSGEVRTTSICDMLDLLRKSKFGADFHLSQKDCADAVAFIELMESRLLPAVLHTYWLDESNYQEFTREAYASAFPLPNAVFQPRWRRMAAATHLSNLEGGGATVGQEEANKRVYRDAFCCLNNLSDKLGTQRYLFGTEPTAADAIMFGYLAPLLHIPFPTNKLKGYLESYPNLSNTVNLIKRIYFTKTEL